MSYHVPDKWVIVKVLQHGNDTPIYKVLGSWKGGYTYGDSWRFSSGITDVEKTKGHYKITNHSGSEYFCDENAEGMLMYTEGVYNRLKKQLENSGTGSIEIISIKELINEL